MLHERRTSKAHKTNRIRGRTLNDLKGNMICLLKSGIQYSYLRILQEEKLKSFSWDAIKTRRVHYNALQIHMRIHERSYRKVLSINLN